MTRAMLGEDLSLEVWQSLVLSKDRVWTFFRVTRSLSGPGTWNSRPQILVPISECPEWHSGHSVFIQRHGVPGGLCAFLVGFNLGPGSLSNDSRLLELAHVWPRLETLNPESYLLTLSPGWHFRFLWSWVPSKTMQYQLGTFVLPLNIHHPSSIMRRETINPKPKTLKPT